MGDFSTNKFVAIALISFIILIAIFKIPVGAGDWSFPRKIALAVISIFVVTVSVYLKDGS